MTLKRRFRLLAAPLALLVSAQAGAAVIEVTKSPYCGCCQHWIEYMQKRGHEVKVTNNENIGVIKDQLKVPDDLRSCHTSKVGKYVVEGHVPAEDVERLLKEQPDAIGIAVPGMPAGSPGMHVHGGEAQAYNTILFTKDGKTKVFASH